MLQLDWRLFVDCASEPAARRVAARWFGKIGLDARALTVAPYPKGGFVLEARSDHASESWPEFVVEALAACQRAGHGWQLRGYVEEELDAFVAKRKEEGGVPTDF